MLNYKPTVSIGEYKFLNVKEAHAYALSTSNNIHDYVFRYLEAAGPQLILWYSRNVLSLNVIYLCDSSREYWSNMISIIEIDDIIKHTGMGPVSSVRAIAEKLAIPCFYMTERVPNLHKIISKCYRYVDNNRYARDLLIKLKFPAHIIAETITAPMKWSLDTRLLPVLISREEFFDILRNLKGGL